MSRILIVEDDKEMAQGLCSLFNREAETDKAYTLSEAQGKLVEGFWDLIILDLNLPDGDGIDFYSSFIRDKEIPVLMLTARDLESDELAGLNAGAEDYLTKPFSPEVLKARAFKILNRRPPEHEERIHSGYIEYDSRGHLFYKKGEPLSLSAIEFRLLEYLLENRGRILLKEQIMDHIWGDEPVDDNTLSVNIRRLRSKIEEEPGHPELIKTVHGMGYRWQDKS